MKVTAVLFLLMGAVGYVLGKKGSLRQGPQSRRSLSAYICTTVFRVSARKYKAVSATGIAKNGKEYCVQSDIINNDVTGAIERVKVEKRKIAMYPTMDDMWPLPCSLNKPGHELEQCYKSYGRDGESEATVEVYERDEDTGKLVQVDEIGKEEATEHEEFLESVFAEELDMEESNSKDSDAEKSAAEDPDDEDTEEDKEESDAKQTAADEP